jgi:hydroxyacylglutathione hydrolase
MNLISIPAFQDNYIWVLVDDDRRASLSIPVNLSRF